jgi:hypothetical protein
MIVQSLIAGSIIGFIDIAGFYWTVKIFLSPSVRHKYVWAGILEAVRLAGLMTIIILLILKSICTLWWLVIPAILISFAGKVIIPFKKLTA